MSWSKDADGFVCKKYPKLSPQYEEFQSFYSRLLNSSLQGKSLKECITSLSEKLHKIPSIPNDLASLYLENITEVSLIHLASLLFQDYTSKKSQITKEKIQKSRNSLPIHKFREEIITLINSNSVVLIAG